MFVTLLVTIPETLAFWTLVNICR